MIKMSPLRASIALLTIVSAAYADVSHLEGYHYPNLGATALHPPKTQASAQYQANKPYTDSLISTNNLPTSYYPPASGSPFDNVAQVSKTYTPTRLSTPQQNPQLNAQKYQSSSNRQQQVQPKSQPRPQAQAQAQYNRVSTNNRQPASAYRAPAIANSYAYPKVQQQTRLPGPALVTKHFYIHAAPDEPEEPTRQRYVQLGQARKNFKIIFIKAPTYNSKSQIIPVLPQNEEKTIVYVLSKKPTIEQNIELPELPVTEPSKPQVFFIKYRTQAEAEQTQQSIQTAFDQANLAGTDSGDQIASQFVSDSSFGVAPSATAAAASQQQTQFGRR